MFKEHLETIMMVSFLVATALSIYKVYVIFEKQAGEGLSIAELEKQIVAIIESILQNSTPTKEELFKLVLQHKDFKQDEYKNFNYNRLNQTLEGMFIEKQVQNYDELLKHYKQ